MNLNFSVTKKQKAFIDATEDEVLFGGAAGGGKSYGQLIDTLIYALKYPGSKQLILRRTYAELQKSLIRASLELFPKELYSFNASYHAGRFKNGSVVDFGYCQNEADVFQYQSAEYDQIRFDELTHFTESQYIYLISRLRGANDFPKQIKSSTNPGGVGHGWVKARFIDSHSPAEPFIGDDGMSRIFIPSLLSDNRFLMERDRGYAARLEALPERQKRALLYGDWDIFEGQYFAEFDRRIHVCEPFRIPADWRRYRTIDYGLDRLACLWIAVSPEGRSFVYRELCRSNLPISVAAKAILDATPEDEDIYATLAPPDLWFRSQESGKSKAIIFAENGLHFTRSSNDRESGWLALKELLQVGEGGPRLQIFRNCTELISCIPMLQIDPLRPTDCRTEPHSITHAPDALRGFAIYRFSPGERPTRRATWRQDMYEDYYNATSEERRYLIEKYGSPW
ncbi:MAG: phage terminase large subunit [Clostridia bacterium]|nr:phage terminase large subunit [Clostridia bacterium]